MSTEKIQQRARHLTWLISSKEDYERDYPLVLNELTAQRDEDEREHKEEVEKLKAERDGWMHSSETWEWTHAKRVEERDALARQVEELSKDNAMLDWLETNRGQIFCLAWDDVDKWQITSPAFDSFSGLGHLGEGADVREAITSAMKGKTHE